MGFKKAAANKMDEGEADQYEQDPYGQERKKIKPGNTVGSKIAAGAKNMKRKAEKFVANTMGHNLERGPLDEQNYTEDMLSPKQQKIASMAGDPKKIDAKDFAALRDKKDKKTEGNRFTAGLANDDIKVGEKIPGTTATKTKDIDEGGDGPEYQAAWKRTQDERKAWEKSNPDKKYYDQGPADRHSMELSKARDTDTAAKDAKRSPLGRVANTLSRGLFGQDIDEGRTSMREGWEEMQKYLEKKVVKVKKLEPVTVAQHKRTTTKKQMEKVNQL